MPKNSFMLVSCRQALMNSILVICWLPSPSILSNTARSPSPSCGAVRCRFNGGVSNSGAGCRLNVEDLKKLRTSRSGSTSKCSCISSKRCFSFWNQSSFVYERRAISRRRSCPKSVTACLALSGFCMPSSIKNLHRSSKLNCIFLPFFWMVSEILTSNKARRSFFSTLRVSLSGVPAINAMLRRSDAGVWRPTCFKDRADES
mmetsp:Transcript_145209/g.278626  ORF Transcript_145209/g.278626 Transcript_145209/m.278626 type:complete len:202 (+) Transcript_145209:229-834(+)